MFLTIYELLKKKKVRNLYLGNKYFKIFNYIFNGYN